MNRFMRYWRQLSHSPAKSNDRPQLELPGAWEPLAVQDLCLIVKDKRPNILFLMETKR